MSRRNRYIYDFMLCPDLAQLKKTIALINHQSYRLISVAHDGKSYVVTFSREAYG